MNDKYFVKFVLMILALFVAGSVSAQSIVFEGQEHDFGEIKEDGKAAAYSFRFVNEGTQPLVITGAVIGCKCTKTKYPRKPLAPDEEGEIEVSYNPRKQNGVFFKTIQIYSNDAENERTILTIKGKVIK